MTYVDGFVIPVPKRNLQAYLRIARQAGRVWREHGALDYKECVGDDLAAYSSVGVVRDGTPPFARMAGLKKGETVFFSFIVYKSRAHRDRVNKRVFADPRMAAMMDPKAKQPFDMKRMAYGGFQVLVQL